MKDRDQRGSPDKSKKQQKPASADEVAKTTTKKGSIELNEEQLDRAAGGLASKYTTSQ